MKDSAHDSVADLNSESASDSRPTRVKKTRAFDLKESENIPWSKKKKKKNGTNGVYSDFTNNTTTNPAPNPVDAATNMAKAKKPITVDIKNGVFPPHVPAKRPRGRPPLPSNRHKIAEKQDVALAMGGLGAMSSSSLPKTVGIKGHFALPLKAKSTFKAQKPLFAKPLPPIVPTFTSMGAAVDNLNPYSTTHLSNAGSSACSSNSSSSAQNSDNFGKNVNASSGSAPTTKPARPSASIVVKKVLSRLMVSDPLTLQEINAGMLDTPKDQLQSVLEVLRVLGVVVQLITRDPGSVPGSGGGGIGMSQPVLSPLSSSATTASPTGVHSSSAKAAPSSSSSSTFTSSIFAPSAVPSSSSGSSSSSSSSGGYFYSLTEFAKGYNAVDLQNLEDDIVSKWREVRELQERNRELEVRTTVHKPLI